jgi:CBS-domain-containing membrane protein
MSETRAPTAIIDRVGRRAGGVGVGAYAAALAFVVLAIAGAVGVASKNPWLFPSLGPSVMLFFETPRAESARPLNALAGHLVGIGAGWTMLHLFDLTGQPSAPIGGLTTRYVLAAAISVAITSAVLTAVHLPHPPAGASTLIVSLGILTTRTELLTMVLAIVLVTAAATVLNRLLGVRSP